MQSKRIMQTPRAVEDGPFLTVLADILGVFCTKTSCTLSPIDLTKVKRAIDHTGRKLKSIGKKCRFDIISKSPPCRLRDTLDIS